MLSQMVYPTPGPSSSQWGGVTFLAGTGKEGGKLGSNIRQSALLRLAAKLIYT